MNFLKALIILALFTTAKTSKATTPEMNERNGYVEPFQMFDNLYYVGTSGSQHI